jgi:hypothetical protein
MPDVLRMYGSTYDPQSVIIFPVADESTRHIQEMVGRQKKEPKSKSQSMPRIVPRKRLNLTLPTYPSNPGRIHREFNPIPYKPLNIYDYTNIILHQNSQPFLNNVPNGMFIFIQIIF